jgi:argininosuccinate synthase
MKLFKGTAKPVKRDSQFSLYDYNLTSFDINTHYDQGDAVGFINLWGLPSTTAWSLKHKALEGELKEQEEKVAPVIRTKK